MAEHSSTPLVRCRGIFTKVLQARDKGLPAILQTVVRSFFLKIPSLKTFAHRPAKLPDRLHSQDGPNRRWPREAPHRLLRRKRVRPSDWKRVRTPALRLVPEQLQACRLRALRRR